MRNKKELVEKVNNYLADLDLPSYRKKVTTSGRNVSWLLKHISKKNKVDKSILDILERLK